MFGSNFPEWDTWKGIERDAFSEEVVNRVMGVNAERLYDRASRARLGNG
jgi:predicted TIM-barrel fold metal-dependent hydrolase